MLYSCITIIIMALFWCANESQALEMAIAVVWMGRRDLLLFFSFVRYTSFENTDVSLLRVQLQFSFSVLLRCDVLCTVRCKYVCVVYCVECKQIGSHMEVIVHIRKVSVFRHFSFSEKTKQQNNLINSSESKAHLIEIENKIKKTGNKSISIV